MFRMLEEGCRLEIDIDDCIHDTCESPLEVTRLPGLFANVVPNLPHRETVSAPHFEFGAGYLAHRLSARGNCCRSLPLNFRRWEQCDQLSCLGYMYGRCVPVRCSLLSP
jgi:hypothetical protein